MGWALTQYLDTETWVEGEQVKRHREKRSSTFREKGLEQFLPSRPPAITLIWDFWPPELWEDQFLLHKVPSLKDLVIAVLGNQYRKKPSPIVCGGSSCGISIPQKRGTSAPLSRPEDFCSFLLSCKVWLITSLTLGWATVCGWLSLGQWSSQTQPPLSSSCFLVANGSSQAAHSLWGRHVSSRAFLGLPFKGRSKNFQVSLMPQLALSPEWTEKKLVVWHLLSQLFGKILLSGTLVLWINLLEFIWY